MSNLSQPLYGASFGDAVVRFFKKYARFQGYASRSEYWWAVLAVNLVALVFMIPSIILDIQAETTGSSPSLISGLLSLLMLAFYVAIIVPMLSLTWRRLHDAGYSGLFFFLSFVPFIGGIILLVFTIMPTNQSAHRPEWNDTRGD